MRLNKLVKYSYSLYVAANWPFSLISRCVQSAVKPVFSVEEILGPKKYRELLKNDYAAGKEVIKSLNKFKIRIGSVVFNVFNLSGN